MIPGSDWRSYRCPVCSHTDGTSFDGTESVRIRCSHCNTELELHVRGPGAASATVALKRGRRRSSQPERA